MEPTFGRKGAWFGNGRWQLPMVCRARSGVASCPIDPLGNAHEADHCRSDPRNGVSGLFVNSDDSHTVDHSNVDVIVAEPGAVVDDNSSSDHERADYLRNHWSGRRRDGPSSDRSSNWCDRALQRWHI